MRTGETTVAIHYTYTTACGLRMDYYPVNTKFFPALLSALFCKPRWLFFFMGGILASLWIDDNYEAIFMERLIVPLIVNPALRENLEPETDTLSPE
jgi:hypothetical protein